MRIHQHSCLVRQNAIWFVTGEDDGKFVALCVCFSRHTQTMNREISGLKGFLLVFYNKTTQRTTERENLSNVIKHNKDFQGGGKKHNRCTISTANATRETSLTNMKHDTSWSGRRRQAKHFQGNVFGGMFGICLIDLIGSSSFAATINWSFQR